MLWNAFWASQRFNFVQWSEWDGGQININLHVCFTFILYRVFGLWYYSYTWSVTQITYFDNHLSKVNHRSFACNANSSFYIISGYCYSIDFDNFIRFQSIVATRSQLFWDALKHILSLSESQLSMIKKYKYLVENWFFIIFSGFF